MIKDNWLAAPGVVFPELVDEYELSPALRHLLWVPPFPWEALAEVGVEEGLAVHWLVALPISDSERRYLEVDGFDPTLPPPSLTLRALPLPSKSGSLVALRGSCRSELGFVPAPRAGLVRARPLGH